MKRRGGGKGKGRRDRRLQRRLLPSESPRHTHRPLVLFMLLGLVGVLLVLLATDQPPPTSGQSSSPSVACAATFDKEEPWRRRFAFS